MPDVCGAKKYPPNQRYFWQILLQIGRTAILQWMSEKASNFLSSTHGTVDLDWYS